MKIESLLGLCLPLLFVLMLWAEARGPARTFQHVARWRLLGIGFFVVTLLVGAITPHLLPVATLRANSLLDLSALGLWGAVAGLATTTFVGYWLHRAEHQFSWLWRATHRMHHSALRVDMAGAYFAHPLETVLKVTAGTLVGTLVLGLDPLAASVVNTGIGILSLFQHWNVRTPRWLGWIVQRPESHTVHHEVGGPGHNFSELPVWDLVFGTFSNPATFHGDVGLDSGERPSVTELLLMRPPVR